MVSLNSRLSTPIDVERARLSQPGPLLPSRQNSFDNNLQTELDRLVDVYLLETPRSTRSKKMLRFDVDDDYYVSNEAVVIPYDQWTAVEEEDYDSQMEETQQQYTRQTTAALPRVNGKGSEGDKGKLVSRSNSDPDSRRASMQMHRIIRQENGAGKSKLPVLRGRLGKNSKKHSKTQRRNSSVPNSTRFPYVDRRKMNSIELLEHTGVKRNPRDYHGPTNPPFALDYSAESIRARVDHTTSQLYLPPPSVVVFPPNTPRNEVEQLQPALKSLNLDA